MYHSPFGSIFSDKPIKPFGQMDPGMKLVNEADSIVAESPEEHPKEAAKAVAEMAQKIEEDQKAEIIRPSRDTVESKEPFSTLPPQFRAATTMRSDDPRVRAEQSKILVEKNKQKLAAVKRQIVELQVKIQAAKVYRDVIGNYVQLPAQDKAALDGWVLIHANAIQKLNAARNLKKKTTDNMEASKALEAEIKHWEGLKTLKGQGVNVSGKIILQNFRPTDKSVSASPKPIGPLPKIGGRVSHDDIVRLTQGRTKSQDLQGLAATDEAAKSLAKSKPQQSYKEIFVQQLPGRDAVMEERNAKGANSRLLKRTEKTMIRAKTLEWEIEIAESQLEALINDYRNIQENLSDMIDTMSSDPQTKKTITALGILIEARPERFLSAPTLIQASMDAFKRLSQLGDSTATPTTPEVEAEKLLDEASTNATASLNELELRQNTLEKLKAEVEDRPPPPPISISVALVPPTPPAPSTGRKAVSFINKALPWIAGAFLLKKLMED